jgi:competence protein ComEA
VHVTGQVAAPGVYELTPRARVIDALESAGGPVDTAVVDQLNLAAPLTDGAQVRVPGAGETPPPGGLVRGGVTPASPNDGSAAAIDLNTADRATLETIPGIGPVTADRIITRRDELGGFSDVEELLDIRGIGPATVEELQGAVVVR